MQPKLQNNLFSFITFIFCIFISFEAKSQIFAPPTGINYQAIARDTTGAPIANASNLSVKFTIWNALTGGTTLFTETHQNVSTNKYGLFTRTIGSVDSASFNAIVWSAGDKFIEIGIDTGGTGFVYMPRTQLLSVPYAYHAKTAEYGIRNWSINGNTINSTNFIGTQNNVDLIFKTNNTEQMRLLANGFLGLGTTTPSSPLTIKTLSNPGTELEFISSGSNADIYANSQLNIGSSNSVNLLTLGSTRLFVESTGKIGIGTVTPAAKFDINGDIKIADGTQGIGKVLTSDATGIAHWDTIPFPYVLGNGLSLSIPNTLNSVWTLNGNNIYNNNSGFVGIGTSTPSSGLDVNGTITISGNNNNEVNRAQTGSANMVPIAYASVNSNGSLNASTGNISCNWVGSGNNYYSITISGENYDTQNFITIVTVVDSNSKAEIDDDGSGHLKITIWSFSNIKIQNAFHFVTYKP